jgi:hypothetical protein
MKYIQYLEYLNKLGHKPGSPEQLKSAIQSARESDACQQELLSDAEIAGLTAELQHFSLQEKDMLICEQVAAINRLAKSNSEFQTANDQLAFTIAEKTHQWMALQP